MSDIVWTRDSEWRSAQHAEKAIIGEYELVVFDLAADEHHQAEIGWEIFAGPGRTDQLATGHCSTLEEAKRAAETAWWAVANMS